MNERRTDFSDRWQNSVHFEPKHSTKQVSQAGRTFLAGWPNYKWIK
jgi:hypothetical protein